MSWFPIVDQNRGFVRLLSYMKKFQIFFAVCSLSLTGTLQAQDSSVVDTLEKKEIRNQNVRGIVREEVSPDDYYRNLISAGLYPARVILNGVLYSTGKSTSVITDEKFIARVEDFFYILERKIGWMPSAIYVSGFQPYYGINLFYQDDHFTTMIGGKYRDENKWGRKAGITYTDITGEKVWQYNFLFVNDKMNDRHFFGFGADPSTDARNKFQPERDEYGVYSQERLKYQAIIGVRSSVNRELYYTVFYQRRDIRASEYGGQSISDVFDGSTIPGLNKTGRQFYNEFSFRFDSREYKKSVSKGRLFSAYAGMSKGISEDKSSFLRAGFDLAAFVPVIKDNRIIIPRVVVDAVSNLKDNIPISFTEYPRQRAFRGVSSRKLAATDNLSIIPSLEYKWPLTYRVSGQLFSDLIIVAEDLGAVKLDHARWAVGFGFAFHDKRTESAKFEFAFGSEGIKLLLSLGTPVHKNERTDWK